MNEGKPWYQSWTIWFNTLMVVVGGVITIAEQLKSALPEETWPVLTAIIVVCNYILRFKSVVPLTK